MAQGPASTAPARRSSNRAKQKRKSNEQPRPYHVGIVAFLTLLAAGLPMASLFKVYTYILCIAYPPAPTEPFSYPIRVLALPPAPSLPLPDPQCALNPRIASTTSSYAAMVTTLGSILALASLDSASRLTRRFGRKPLMLLMHLLLILGYTTIRFGTALSQAAAPPVPGSDNEKKKRVTAATAIPGLVLVMIGAVLAETAQGAPLRIALQNYIVDTVPPEEQEDDQDVADGDAQEQDPQGDAADPTPSSSGSRASALSFLEGVGQLGAFPSSTLGGLLAAYTTAFFAPFYAAILCVGLAFAWALFGVPESKQDRQHIGIIDGFDPSSRAPGDTGSTSEHGASEAGDEHAGRQGSQEQRREERQGTRGRKSLKSRLRRLLAFTNFLRPLAVFAPVRAKSAASTGSSPPHSSDFRLPILAVLILCEETFQAFLIPAILLYCSDVFRYNQLQEGYLVSIMQGTRAIWLALVFPRVLAWARNVVSKRAETAHGKKRPQNSTSNGGESETSPLLRSGTGRAAENEYHQTEEIKAMARSRLDMIVLLVSYTGSVLAFVLLAVSATASPSSSLSPPADEEGNKTKAWWILISGLVLLQLSSGSAWIRTALVVNAASSLPVRRRLASTKAGRERHQDAQRAQGSQAGSAISSYQGGSQLTIDEEGAVSTSTAESLALAANQIVITFTTALMPIVTSLVYARGLQASPNPFPQAVWVFKGAVAGASALVGILLAWEGERVHRRETRRTA
ncbi:hypothetical protein OC846_001217 [Tilletia horrida]|uniref:Uncharacterized protein n=1 Tax=Tilletia horrida TaxID=155126 RepID=A0AAN6GU81_9BASI|nr:hypothetical protein OC845_000247 [Tilletia horrida]KAK0556394.1 hypothetical protein OC846_001217 [Tilletia horrida]KAK0569294.1 hypothetical protein OC861_001109 [Tilletia horrida]